MKKVAIVGFGFMGRMHYGVWRKLTGAKVAAVCDANLAQITAKVSGNLAGADNSSLPPSVKIFDSFDALLAAGGFDVVDITLPTPLHPDMAVKALEAGFHVLCEKPMALDAKACDRMLAAAKKAKGRFMVAQCLRFWPDYVYLKDLIAKKTYGKVVAADFSRRSAAPGWGTGGTSWFLDEKKSGGVILDFHVHDADVVNWLFGMPETVSSHAHAHADGWTDFVHTVYGYADKVVTSSVSWAETGSFQFESGFRVTFEKASVVNDGRRSTPYMVYPAAGKPFAPKLSTSTGYENEIKWFLASIEGKAAKGPLTPEDARNSVAIVDAERKSAATGRIVKLAAGK